MCEGQKICSRKNVKTSCPKSIEFKCSLVIDHDSIISVTKEEPDLKQKFMALKTIDDRSVEEEKDTHNEKEMKLVITYSNFKKVTLYFDDFQEYYTAEGVLTSVNVSDERNIAVLVNPVSGKRQGMQHVRRILVPMLFSAEISYEILETDSSTYVETWVEQFNNKPFPYTDIVCVGGDGLFSQLINSIGKSPKSEELFKIHIGLLPCGTQNAIV